MEQITAKALVRRHCADLTAEQQESVYTLLRSRRDVQTGRKALRAARLALGFTAQAAQGAN